MSPLIPEAQINIKQIDRRTTVLLASLDLSCLTGMLLMAWMLSRRPIIVSLLSSTSTVSHWKHLSTAVQSGPHQKIEKILIANRGEIACRIMRTSRRLGIRTVAVYSDADKDSLHVKAADVAVRIGPPPARLSYLNASAIIEAAKRTGAQAIHPGYGFLSEDVDFSELCEAEGFIFIGPPTSAIRAMGDKSASKKIMETAGMPLVPGYNGNVQDTDLMRLEAEKIGYPVLIKPTRGGGGKGMKIVNEPGEFLNSFLAAQREAGASFGVNTVLLEKYIVRPRHIEVQVFGDKYGRIIHLHERDCSIQRRYQKIIEETPAPNISEAFRTLLCKAAVSAAEAVAYHSAGTVEFIVDTLSGEFYFMEMNTRLQVEHPVTEMIIGQDLVEWQIRVACGEPLPLIQSQVPLLGHALEARIYAENVSRGFLPATGILQHYRPTPTSQTVRVETGVSAGDTISMHYDPMIAKLVVHAENRNAAVMKLRDCLSKFQVGGLQNNINFLQRVTNHFAFKSGLVETNFIEQFRNDLMDCQTDERAENHTSVAFSAAMVAACLCKQEQMKFTEKFAGQDKLLSLWYVHPPFRVHHLVSRTIILEWENDFGYMKSIIMTFTVHYKSDGTYLVEGGDIVSCIFEITQLGPLDFRISATGLCLNISLAHYFQDCTKHIDIWSGEQHYHFRQTNEIDLFNAAVLDHSPVAQIQSNIDGSFVAPMAGLVVKVLVQEGDIVAREQPILVIEAMKMEHVVKAPRAGFVRGLQVSPGQQIADSSALFNIEVIESPEDGCDNNPFKDY